MKYFYGTTLEPFYLIIIFVLGAVQYRLLGFSRNHKIELCLMTVLYSLNIQVNAKVWNDMYCGKYTCTL